MFLFYLNYCSNNEKNREASYLLNLVNNSYYGKNKFYKKNIEKIIRKDVLTSLADTPLEKKCLALFKWPLVKSLSRILKILIRFLELLPESS